MLVCELLIGPEKILKERDVLAETGLLAERLWSLGIVFVANVPDLGL